ncbi:MAG: FHA domain-containing protein [Pirellulales bacterium]
MSKDSQKNQYTVGSSEQADIVINQPTVSRIHCRFEWNGGLWVLHDLNSTNGTFVNGMRITEATRLSASDIVTLGRGIACEIPETPQLGSPGSNRQSPASSRKVVSEPVSNTTGAKKKIVPTGIIVALAGFAIAAVLLVALLFMNRSAPTKTEADSQAKSTGSEDAKSNNNPEQQTANQNSSTRSDAAASSGNPQAALWMTVVASADGKTQKLLGTAIAIEPKRLVTLASLIHAAELVKDEFPQLKLINLQNPELTISSPKVRSHPNYAKAMDSFATFEKDLAEKMKSLTTLEEPSLEDKLKWSERFESIMEAISNADLAIIETSVTLPGTLIAAQSKSTQTNAVNECRLIGFPLISPSPALIGSVKSYWLELQGQIVSDTLASRDYQVETVGLAAVSTVSLACVDNQNQLLGIATRQASGEGTSLKKTSKVIPIRLFE